MPDYEKLQSEVVAFFGEQWGGDESPQELVFDTGAQAFVVHSKPWNSMEQVST